ncbi:MAG: HAD family hydrolase [Gammaproteobacteria bacterium]
MSEQPRPIAFLFDVDNTLLDNDRFEDDLGAWFDREIGPGSAQRYWAAYEVQRRKMDYADYLGALQHYWDDTGRDPRWMSAGEYLLEYPFAGRLYPGALDVLAHLATFGPVWLVSDGDAVMQPRKLRHAGLWDAVEGRVLIYIHKEHRLPDIEQRCGADHYVMIDDKLRVLDAMKQQWGKRLTTVLPRQGHYALDPAHAAGHPPADITIDRIGALAGSDPRLFGAPQVHAAAREE